MSTPEQEAFAEGMNERLTAYIGERTALPREVIQQVLDAQAAFWAERPEALAEMLMDGLNDDEDC